MDIFNFALKVKNGKRPEFKYLIIRSWSQDTTNRLIFDQIMDELRNDHNYINEKEYSNYIKLIDKHKITFRLN